MTRKQYDAKIRAGLRKMQKRFGESDEWYAQLVKALLGDEQVRRALKGAELHGDRLPANARFRTAYIERAKNEPGIYEIVASTQDVDRMHEVILASAYKKSLPGYLERNPVILYGHDHWGFPVGRAVGGRVTKEDLRLKMEFAPTDLGQETQKLYDGGFLNAFSVGFVPNYWVENAKDVKELLDEVGIKYDKENVPQRVYTDVDLLEVSAVPVPANEYATMVRSVGTELPAIKAASQLLGTVLAPDGEKAEDGNVTSHKGSDEGGQVTIFGEAALRRMRELGVGGE